jgi:cytoskeletal protein CcmA (bactofilin family)
MFNKEDSNSKNGTNAKSPSLNMISEGTRIKGDLQSDNDIRISGNVDGQANSKGRVIVTSKGHIEGNVKAKDADIAGKLDGEMFISGKLILRQTAVINGDIHTKTLLVEEGAQINGNCKMGLDSSNSTEGRVNNIKEIKKPEKQTGS